MDGLKSECLDGFRLEYVDGFVGIRSMVAQMERRFIKERQRDGIEQAKAEGTYKGGKRRLDREAVMAMHASGFGPAAIAKAIGCSRMQVYRITEGNRHLPVSATTIV